jgi:hypothetical protein
MSSSGIKSKPVYEPLSADTSGRYHLMLGMGSGIASLRRVLDELEATAPTLLHETRVLVLDPAVGANSAGGAIASIAAHTTAGANSARGDGYSATDAGTTVVPLSLHGLSAPPLAGLHWFADRGSLLGEFRSLLEHALMGTRLYIAGPESFIGLAMRTALEFNLNRDEIRAEESGSRARRVYCVHCRAVTEEVRTNVVQCAQCARWLLVRDHYSRRLAAYMGVMVDAEAPGQLPPITEVYA